MTHILEKKEYNRQQANWFRACSATHRIWCNCGDWQGHISKYRGWCTELKGHTASAPTAVTDMLMAGGGGEGISTTEDILEAEKQL